LTPLAPSFVSSSADGLSPLAATLGTCFAGAFASLASASFSTLLFSLLFYSAGAAFLASSLTLSVSSAS
jgi:hypothetical protein